MATTSGKVVALGKRSDNVLSAPILEARIVKMMVGKITVILSVVIIRLGRLDEIIRRWIRGRDRYNVRSLLDAIKDRANRPLPLLLILLLSMKIGDALLSGYNKYFVCLGVLKCIRISAGLQDCDIDLCSEASHELLRLLALRGHHCGNESR